MSKLSLVIVCFLIIGGLIIHQEVTGKKEFVKTYLSWLAHLAGNLKEVGKHAITGYYWLPQNNTTDDLLNHTKG